jgi:predicted nucleotidyltransferase
VRIVVTKNKKPIDWLFPEVRKKVLALLLAKPDQQWYLRDIERRTGLAIGTVRRELIGLANVGIITKSKDGNRTYYQANTVCPFFHELSGLLRKTAGLVDVLSEALESLAIKIKVAFIYGSMATGSAKSQSDVDLMVIGKCSFGEVVEALMPGQEKLCREVNPSVYPIDEFQKKLEAEHHFLKTILRESKVFLIGNEDELARLAEQ